MAFFVVASEAKQSSFKRFRSWIASVASSLATTIKIESYHIMKHIFQILIITALILLTACNRFGENNLPEPTVLEAFSPTVNTTLLWSHSVGSGVAEQALRFVMASAQDRIFTTDAKGHVEATEASTGRLLWKHDLKTSVSSGIAVSGSLVAIVGENATLTVLDASEGKILWTAELPNQALAVPTITQDKIFVKTIDEQVLAFDTQTGKLLWTFAAASQQLILRFGSSPIVAGDKLIIGSVSGKVFALNIDDGSILWEQIIAVPNGITDVQQMVDIDMNPVVDKENIYVASYQGNLAALDLSTGTVLWHKEFSSFTGLAIKEDNLYITDANSNLYQIDKSNGNIVWKQDKLAFRWITAPVLLDQFILVADQSGYVHILSDETGHFAGRINTGKDPILSAPVVYQDKFYVLNQAGVLAAYEIRV
jgi:outer membrane protein assembly factor BamB